MLELATPTIVKYIIMNVCTLLTISEKKQFTDQLIFRTGMFFS